MMTGYPKYMDILINKLWDTSFTEVWIRQVILVALGTVLANVVSHFLLRHAERIANLIKSPWNGALIQAAKSPLHTAIWLIGITFAASIVSNEFDFAIINYVHKAREVGVTICLTWYFIRLINNVTNYSVAKRKEKGEEVDQTTHDALSKLARLTVVIISILVVIQDIGFSVSGVLTAGGIGGIAIGFAAKDLLANFFGGLTIYLDRPFSVGDWIRSPDKEIEGTVEYISWRHTRIRGFNKNPIYVPNALFTNIVVENPTRMTHRRIKETIGIRYEDIGVMGAIVADVKAMLQNNEEIDATQTLIVNFNTFSPSSLDFFIYTFTKTKNWIHFHEVKQDVLLKVAGIIDRHGAQIAFPTRTVHMEEATPLPGTSVTAQKRAVP